MVFQSFAIVPAAGRSLRMGQPKLLLPWNESTVIETVLQTWQASGVSRTIVVLHPADAELLAVCQRTGAVCVVAEVPPPDMKASVLRALEWIETNLAVCESDAFLLAPADMPLLTAETIGRVLAAHQPAAPALLLAEHAGRRGHPVLFPWSLAAEVAALGAEQGINQLLTRHPVTAVACGEDAVSADLDTPADYQNLRNRARRTAAD